MWAKIMQRFVAWLDPKLDKFRPVKYFAQNRNPRNINLPSQPEYNSLSFTLDSEHLSRKVNSKTTWPDNSRSSGHFSEFSSKKPGLSVAPAPQTTLELIDLLRRTPDSVLSEKDRARIAAAMTFDQKTVGDLMVSKKQMLFIRASDFLGPLMLDKLYKTGYTHFPVIDSKEKVVGVVSTSALNSLEITSSHRAREYMEEKIFYLHTTDSLTDALAAIDKKSFNYFLVLDKNDDLAGFFTLDMILKFLLGG